MPARFPEPGETLGRYELDRELGRGGMGVVWLARDLELDRRIALKLINPDISEDDAFRQRFLREMRVAAGLANRGIVPVYEAGTVDGRLFIAMQYVEGEDLRSLLKRAGSLSAERTAEIATQLGEALDAAHQRGLVHRDVKPANILLDGTGPNANLYLSDFGLAREAASESGLTNSGNWMGTIDYVSPEQLDGAAVSARSDIYAMGCLLYQAFTGDVPFAGSVARKVYAHANEPLPSVGAVGGARTAAIDAVLSRATAKDPQARFASAGDLGRAFAAATGGRPVGEDHTVATGSALDGTTEYDLPAARTETVLDGTRRPGVGDTSSAQTQRTPPEKKGVSRIKSPVAVAIGVLVLLALVGGGAFLLLSGDSGNKKRGTPVTTAAHVTQGTTGPKAPTPPTTTAADTGPINVRITAPSAGSSFNRSIVEVRGTVVPKDATVRVQGRLASVEDGFFHQNHVQLHPGRNTIDVDATTPDQDPYETTIAILRVVPANTTTTTSTTVPSTSTTAPTPTVDTPALNHQIVGRGFLAHVPDGDGWSVSSPQELTIGTGTRRVITGPAGEVLRFLVPDAPAMPPKANVVSQEPITTQAASSLVSILRDFSSTECAHQLCTDVTLNDPSWTGIAILANGTPGSLAAETAEAIARTVRPNP